MVGEIFSAKGFLKKYKSEMSTATFECLDALNKYFGGKNIIQRIRTKFAFHVDANTIATAYANAPADFVSVEYLSTRYTGHNLFHTAETLSLIAMIGDGPDSWRSTLIQQATLMQMVDEIIGTCVTLGTFLSGFIGLILSKHLGLKMEHLEAAETTISDDPSIDKVRLPFFCQPPRSRSSET